jgi:1,4-dihydroxy-2-naphthoate octaprenyltransferase
MYALANPTDYILTPQRCLTGEYLVCNYNYTWFADFIHFANDYGDGIKGTDNEDREIKRAIQSGVITPKEMKGAIIITFAYVAICHIIDLFCLEDTNLYYSLFYLILEYWQF